VALLAAGRSEVTLFSFVALGLLGGLAAGPIMSLPSRVLKPETRALGMGLFFTVFYMIQASAPWIAGAASSSTGSAAAAFDAGVVFLAITVGLVALFLRLAERPRT
jgi:uncharacterized membrane protein